MKSEKTYFDRTIFKKTILRFWPLWAAYSAIWFVPMPLNGLMMLQLDAQAHPGVNDGHMLSFAKNVVTQLHTFALAMAVVFGALAAMAVLSHLYSAKSANFFGSLPVRREGLFLTHYLAGLAFLIVPNLVVFLLTLIIEAAGGGLYLTGLLFWLAYTCAECFFFYSLAVFCGMFTGHILALPAFYAVINGIVVVFFYLIDGVLDAFYYGYGNSVRLAADAVKWLTPVWKLSRDIGGLTHEYVSANETHIEIGPYGWGILAAYAAAAVALSAGAFLLYRARRLESAGDVVSVKPMRPVFKYGVALCSGMCLGMLTAGVVYMHEPGIMASILIWAVVGYFVAQMLLDKSFRVFHKWKGAAAVAGVFVALFLVVGFDLTGYETRIPDPEQVEWVELSMNTSHWLGDKGDHLELAPTDPKLIEYVVMLHQAAVDQEELENGGTSGYDRVGYLYVSYHLKNGSTLSRMYNSLWMNPDQVDQEGSTAWVISQMYQDRDLYWKAYGFEEADRRMAEEGYRLEQAIFNGPYERIGASDTEALNPDYYYGKDAEALYAAVKEDFWANRIGVRSVDGENSGEKWGANSSNNLEFKFVHDEGTINMSYDEGTINMSYWIEICVQDTASSTWALLKQLEAENAGDHGEAASAQMESGAELLIPPPGEMAPYPTVSAAPAAQVAKIMSEPG